MDPKRDSQKKQNRYRVFAIYAEIPDNAPIIFVGITRMENLKTLLRYHRNTDGVANEFFEVGIQPEIFLLEDTYMKRSLAYQYSIAWGRYFLEKDFDYIAPYRVYEDALDLYGTAEKIYQGISDIPLDAVLWKRKNIGRMPQDEQVSDNKEPNIKREHVTERLSVRITEEERDIFFDFCKEKNVTQREGLRLLLANYKSKKDYAATVIEEQNRRIKQLENENKKQKEAPKKEQAYKRLDDNYQFVKRGIAKYARAQYKLDAPQERLPCKTWERFKWEFPSFWEYNYPVEGFFIFRLEAMCYGGGNFSAIFLFRRISKTGEKVKLRVYDKKEFCGLYPTRNDCYAKGMKFFVGCRRLYPNVADAVFLCPMAEQSGLKENEPEMVDMETNGEYDVVDDIIKNAKRRQKVTW